MATKDSLWKGKQKRFKKGACIRSLAMLLEQLNKAISNK